MCIHIFIEKLEKCQGDFFFFFFFLMQKKKNRYLELWITFIPFFLLDSSQAVVLQIHLIEKNCSCMVKRVFWAVELTR